jgi:hypothetical protein
LRRCWTVCCCNCELSYAVCRIHHMNLCAFLQWFVIFHLIRKCTVKIKLLRNQMDIIMRQPRDSRALSGHGSSYASCRRPVWSPGNYQAYRTERRWGERNVYTTEGILHRDSAVKVKMNAVSWDVTPCGFCKNRRFGGT